MFHPERHTLFTSLTLFNPFFCGIVSNCIRKWVCKKKQTNKKERFKLAIMGEAVFSLTFNQCYVIWWTHFGKSMEEYLTISLYSTSRNHNKFRGSVKALISRTRWLIDLSPRKRENKSPFSFRKTPNIPKNRKLARNVKISYHDNRKTKRVSAYQSVWDL